MVMGIDYTNDPIHSAMPINGVNFTGAFNLDDHLSGWKRLHSLIESNQSDESLLRRPWINSEITPFSGNESLEILKQIQRD